MLLPAMSFALKNAPSNFGQILGSKAESGTFYNVNSSGLCSNCFSVKHETKYQDDPENWQFAFEGSRVGTDAGVIAWAAAYFSPLLQSYGFPRMVRQNTK